MESTSVYSIKSAGKIVPLKRSFSGIPKTVQYISCVATESHWYIRLQKITFTSPLIKKMRYANGIYRKANILSSTLGDRKKVNTIAAITTIHILTGIFVFPYINYYFFNR